MKIIKYSQNHQLLFDGNLIDFINLNDKDLNSRDVFVFINNSEGLSCLDLLKSRLGEVTNNDLLLNSSVAYTWGSNTNFVIFITKRRFLD